MSRLTNILYIQLFSSILEVIRSCTILYYIIHSLFICISHSLKLKFEEKHLHNSSRTLSVDCFWALVSTFLELYKNGEHLNVEISVQYFMM